MRLSGDSKGFCGSEALVPPGRRLPLLCLELPQMCYDGSSDIEGPGVWGARADKAAVTLVACAQPRCACSHRNPHSCTTASERAEQFARHGGRGA